MSSKPKFDPSSSVDKLFREFPEGRDKREDNNNAEAGARANREGSPFMRAIDGLASIFERETKAVSDGDYDAFKRIQNEKLAAIRNVERLQARQNAAVNDMDRDILEARLKRFNVAVERNMKALEGVRTATRAVHRYALKALEEKFSDGVYAPDGSIKSPQCLSVNGNQIKL